MSTMGRFTTGADDQHLPYSLSPDKRLSPYSYAVDPDEVPTVHAKLASQGWQEIPRIGRLEYSRLYGQGVTLIVYNSGLVLTIGIQAAPPARGAFCE